MAGRNNRAGKGGKGQREKGKEAVGTGAESLGLTAADIPKGTTEKDIASVKATMDYLNGLVSASFRKEEAERYGRIFRDNTRSDDSQRIKVALSYPNQSPERRRELQEALEERLQFEAVHDRRYVLYKSAVKQLIP